ncbi:MAG TPA: hypothetical protein VHF69_13425 [Candidatus Synoicihabitans sp.]|nr:hypothetical protein [Candidatus Synoicihabitans sp.]
MPKKQEVFFLDPEVLPNLEKVAKYAHMEPKHYGALWLSRLSDLKPEYALDALTAIPKEFFKGRPGRPATGSSRTNRNRDEATTEHFGEHSSGA